MINIDNWLAYRLNKAEKVELPETKEGWLTQFLNGLKDRYGDDARGAALKKLYSKIGKIALQHLKDKNEKCTIEKFEKYVLDKNFRQEVLNSLNSEFQKTALQDDVIKSVTEIIDYIDGLQFSELQKAIDLNNRNAQKVLKDVSKDTTKMFDFSFHDKPEYHVDENFSKVVEDPNLETDEKALDEGAFPKVVYKDTQNNNTYMLKSYYSKGLKNFKLRNHSIGWSAITTNRLFKQAGLGDMVSQVGTYKVNEVPMIVTKFESPEGMEKLGQLFREKGRQNVFNKNEAANNLFKISLMDYLVGNKDRNPGNILLTYKHNKPTIVAIDNDLSFLYNLFNTNSPVTVVSDPLWFVNRVSPLAGFLGLTGEEVNYNEVSNWWLQNKDNLKNELIHHIKGVTNPDKRNHILINFLYRHNLLTKWANGEFGDLDDINALAIPTFTYLYSPRKLKNNSLYKEIKDYSPQQAISHVIDLIGEDVVENNSEKITPKMEVLSHFLEKISPQEVPEVLHNVFNKMLDAHHDYYGNIDVAGFYSIILDYIFSHFILPRLDKNNEIVYRNDYLDSVQSVLDDLYNRDSTDLEVENDFYNYTLPMIGKLVDIVRSYHEAGREAA